MGFAEQRLRLFGLLEQADELGMSGKPEQYRLVLLQVIAGYEALAAKKRKEALTLREQIVFCEAQATTCEQMVQILGDIVETTIRKERQAREELARQAAERAERQVPLPEASPPEPPAADEGASPPEPQPPAPTKRRGRRAATTSTE